ncbi:MAG: hypothetical protein HYV45_03045 [Candidatus Moranbacteria bacterium]|nr:hypothetical protein [Candidatus Moranbacteria bacterium]
MDIVSHGLWGSGIFGRRSRRDFFMAFLFGVAPDLLSFGFFLLGVWFGFFDHPDWRSGQHPDASQIPLFVYTLYDYTHSLVIFLGVFLLIWLIRGKPFFPLVAWGFHILLDIPTHASFFPTPFLWPLSDFVVYGIPWNNPFIFVSNVILLIVLYGSFFIRKRGREEKEKKHV